LRDQAFSVGVREVGQACTSQPDALWTSPRSVTKSDELFVVKEFSFIKGQL